MSKVRVWLLPSAVSVAAALIASYAAGTVWVDESGSVVPSEARSSWMSTAPVRPVPSDVPETSRTTPVEESEFADRLKTPLPSVRDGQ